jgi:hypothetical protein
MMKTSMPKLKGKAKLSRQSWKLTSRKMLKDVQSCWKEAIKVK